MGTGATTRSGLAQRTGHRGSRAGIAAAVILGGILPLATSVFPSDTTMASWLLVAVLGVGTAVLAPPRGAVPRPLAITLTIGIGVFVLSALTGATPMLSLLGRYPRYEGLITIVGYALALVGGCQVLGPGEPARRRLFLSATAVATLVSAAVCLGQVAFAPDARVTGLLGNSSILGGWAALTFCVLGAHAWHSPRSRLSLAGTVAAALVLVLSASRAAWLGIGVVLVLAAGIALIRGARRNWWFPLVGLGVLVLAVWLLPTTRDRAVGTTPFANATVSGRLLLWRETSPLIADHAALGVGPSAFVDAIGAFHTPGWAAAVGPYAPPDSPHNVVLQVLSATGIAGLAAAVAIVTAAARTLWRHRPLDRWQWGAIAGCAAVGIGCLFSFTDPVTTTVALFVLGGAVSSPLRPGASGGVARIARAAAIAWLAAAVLFTGSALVAEARFSAALASGTRTTDELVAAADGRPWDPDLTIRIGRAVAELAANGALRPEPAVPPVSHACAELPSSIACRLVLADLQTLAGDASAAVATLTAADRLDPANVDRLLKLGIAQAEAGSVVDAEASFQRAALLRPSAAEPWQNLAVLYRQLGRDADAAAAQEKADLLQKR